MKKIFEKIKEKESILYLFSSHPEHNMSASNFYFKNGFYVYCKKDLSVFSDQDNQNKKLFNFFPNEILNKIIELPNQYSLYIYYGGEDIHSYYIEKVKNTEKKVINEVNKNRLIENFKIFFNCKAFSKLIFFIFFISCVIYFFKFDKNCVNISENIDLNE